MFEYQHKAMRRASRRPRARRTELLQNQRATVVTLLDPDLRQVIDTGASDWFARVHVGSVSEAAAAVRRSSPAAVLLSPSVLQHASPSSITALVTSSPGVVTVAVLGEDWPLAQNNLLALGACGVRRVVNLAEREGWSRLRSIVDQVGGELADRILGALLSSLGDACAESRHFFAWLVRLSPTTVTVGSLAAELGVKGSTLMSRFFRAGLPAPKSYLSMTRLAYAAGFLENPRVSMACAANRLRYSSPQSFGRHVRSVLGLTSSEYRREYNLDAALRHLDERLLAPYRKTFSSFRPIELPIVTGFSEESQDSRRDP